MLRRWDELKGQLSQEYLQIGQRLRRFSTQHVPKLKQIPVTQDQLVITRRMKQCRGGLRSRPQHILLAFGIVQIGLSLKSHDPSQRANGFLTLAGGVIITFAKEILNLITGG